MPDSDEEVQRDIEMLQWWEWIGMWVWRVNCRRSSKDTLCWSSIFSMAICHWSTWWLISIVSVVWRSYGFCFVMLKLYTILKITMELDNTCCSTVIWLHSDCEQSCGQCLHQDGLRFWCVTCSVWCRIMLKLYRFVFSREVLQRHKPNKRKPPHQVTPVTGENKKDLKFRSTKTNKDKIIELNHHGQRISTFTHSYWFSIFPSGWGVWYLEGKLKLHKAFSRWQASHKIISK